MRSDPVFQKDCLQGVWTAGLAEAAESASRLTPSGTFNTVEGLEMVSPLVSSGILWPMPLTTLSSGTELRGVRQAPSCRCLPAQISPTRVYLRLKGPQS